uniref:Ig-like domain-containing protein n=1 Tax=Kryptolebias marmoratus TaxID=37003 RepID=A0A3Q3GPQ9_KRYMA
MVNALVPVITVRLGERVTLTCAVSEKSQSITWIHWYKQSAGGTLNLIFMHQKSINPSFEPGFPASRFSASSDEKMSNLTILRTVERDEGIYHCAHMDWTKSTWYGTYLSIKGNYKI